MSYRVDTVVRVLIEDDYDLCAAFGKWQLDTRTFALSTPYSGRGGLLEYWQPTQMARVIEVLERLRAELDQKAEA